MRISKQVRQVRIAGVKIPVGTHPGAVAGAPTMEMIVFSVRPLMTSRHKQRVRSDRSGSESSHRRGQIDFTSMAMNMARPHSDDPEAMPIRPPRSLVPGESQVSDEFEDRPQGPGTMILAPRDISGRSTGSQNPGQFDEHEERKFTGFGYDALLKSTAGWGSSSKQGSDADRPNPNTAKSEFDTGEEYNFADEEEDQSRRNARIRDAARPRSLSRGAARDLRVDRDARGERERARDSREVLRGLEAIHDREGPIGPPVIGDTPNVPPFPYITFGGPLNQRDENSNRVAGSPRITERAADVVIQVPEMVGLPMHLKSMIVRRLLAR